MQMQKVKEKMLRELTDYAIKTSQGKEIVVLINA